MIWRNQCEHQCVVHIHHWHPTHKTGSVHPARAQGHNKGLWTMTATLDLPRPCPTSICKCGLAQVALSRRPPTPSSNGLSVQSSGSRSPQQGPQRPSSTADCTVQVSKWRAPQRSVLRNRHTASGRAKKSAMCTPPGRGLNMAARIETMKTPAFQVNPPLVSCPTVGLPGPKYVTSQVPHVTNSRSVDVKVTRSPSAYITHR